MGDIVDGGFGPKEPTEDFKFEGLGDGPSEKDEMMAAMAESMEALLPFYEQYMPKLMNAMMPSMQPVVDMWSKSMATAFVDELENRGLVFKA